MRSDCPPYGAALHAVVDSVIRDDAAKWCKRIFRVHLDNGQQLAHDIGVTVQRFADSGKDGLAVIDPPLIEVGGRYLTLKEAAAFQRAIGEAAELMEGPRDAAQVERRPLD